MRPLLWIAAGGATLAGLFLATRKTETLQSTPPKSYGETERITLAVPPGWRRVTSSEVSELPELVTHASALRSTPGFTSMQYGSLAPFTASNGATYATWIEQHYHEPGGSAKPWGLHHGVTILARSPSTPGTLLDEWWGVL